MKRATVSARPQGRPVGGCTVLELQAYSTAIRAVSPTASDAAARASYLAYRGVSEAIGVSKFAVDYAVRHQRRVLLCSLFVRCATKNAKSPGPMIARGLSGKAGESSHRRRGRFAGSSTAHRLEDRVLPKPVTVAPARLPKTGSVAHRTPRITAAATPRNSTQK